MDIIYLSGEKLQVGHLVQQSGPSAVFILKQMFQLRHGEPATDLSDDEDPPYPSGDRHLNDQDSASLYYASDFVPQKARADVLLHATACAPRGAAVPSVDVRMKVGRHSKSLRVFGNRRWEWSVLRGDRPGEPQAFTTMPITYENALGGAGAAKNPIGKGWGNDAEDLPNIEHSDKSVTSRRDSIDPAGFGPIDPNWQQRSSLVGTFGDKWLKEHWPSFPDDFDFGYFNAAPRDQQVEGYLRGDEVLEFENLHPEHPLYRSRLPGLAARCFLYERPQGGQSSFREVPLVLDTLWIDLTVERLALVWRGSVPVRSRKLHQVKRVVIATELLTARKPIEHYHQAMYAYLAAEEAEFEVEVEDTSAEDAATDRQFAEVESEFAEIDEEFGTLEAEAVAEEARTRERHIAQEVDPAIFERTPQEANAIPQTTDQIEQVREVNLGLADKLAALQAEAPKPAEIEKQFDEESAAADADFADEPPWTRERVVECHTAGEPIGGAELDELDLSGLTLAGADFTGASMRKTRLVGTNLSGANMSGVDLTGADLSQADLREATLNDAVLNDAKLSGAAVKNLSLNGTDLSKLDLKGLDFSGSCGRYAEFSEADLTGAKFHGAVFDGADFDKAKLAKADFRRAVLKECDFSSTQAAGASLEGGDLTNIRCENADFTGANLRGVHAEGSVWEQAILNKADLSGGVFKNSEFSEASAREAIFDRADCTECSFDDADLEAAKLTRCNLLRASFARAELRQADCRHSNCYEADFFAAGLESTSFHGTNLRCTLLAEARHG